MRTPRAYAADLQRDTARVRLSPEESAHLTRVLRAKVGRAVRVFNGKGLERHAEVETVGREGVTLCVTGEATPAPEPAVHITLGQSGLTGSSFETVVRDTVALGAAVIVPLVSRATQASARHRLAHRERWHRIAVSSAKQCGRAVLPEIRPPQSVEHYVTSVADNPALKLMLAEPSVTTAARPSILRQDSASTVGSIESPTGSARASPVEDQDSIVTRHELVSKPKPDAVIILAGPEGGWAEDEVKPALSAGFRLLSLGDRTFRAEAVGLIALSALTFIWEE
ncbi:MAG: RsmE family RNA methyltransferase [Acidimicrobiia bacterium]